MEYYIEITLINSLEIKTYDLWSKIYTQLHLALVEIKNQKVNIGVSFPEYRFNSENGFGNLGAKLRLFAKTEEELKQLNICKWLVRLADYLHISSTHFVPKEKITAYVTFRRKQIKTNTERLARRYLKRHANISFDEAVKLYQNSITLINLPYIQMKSLTNNQEYKLFIEKYIAENTNEYEYNTYGLSSKSTVPEF